VFSKAAGPLKNVLTERFARLLVQSVHCPVVFNFDPHTVYFIWGMPKTLAQHLLLLTCCCYQKGVLCVQQFHASMLTKFTTRGYLLLLVSQSIPSLVNVKRLSHFEEFPANVLLDSKSLRWLDLAWYKSLVTVASPKHVFGRCLFVYVVFKASSFSTKKTPFSPLCSISTQEHRERFTPYFTWIGDNKIRYHISKADICKPSSCRVCAFLSAIRSSFVFGS